MQNSEDIYRNNREGVCDDKTMKKEFFVEINIIETLVHFIWKRITTNVYMVVSYFLAKEGSNMRLTVQACSKKSKWTSVAPFAKPPRNGSSQTYTRRESFAWLQIMQECKRVSIKLHRFFLCETALIKFHFDTVFGCRYPTRWNDGPQNSGSSKNCLQPLSILIMFSVRIASIATRPIAIYEQTAKCSVCLQLWHALRPPNL